MILKVSLLIVFLPFPLQDDPRQSTMFGDKADSDDSDAEEVSRVTSPRGGESEDSDIIVTNSRPGSRISKGEGVRTPPTVFQITLF